MLATQENMEATHEQPDPVQLLNELGAIGTDEKKFTYLRKIFLEEADVDEYIHFLDTDEDLDLTRKQITRLKASLEGFKVYLKDYIERTGKSIERFDERFKKNVEALADPDLSPEEASELARKRVGFSKAMRAVAVPRGAKGKSLREMTQKGPVLGVEAKKEMSLEEIDEYLGEFKKRFDALPQLHEGIEWLDVEKALRADTESMRKLHALDEKGHAMNVFGEENGELIFASAWNNYEQVKNDHRQICFDLEGQKIAEERGHKPNGNAVSLIADIMGVTEDEARNYLADPKLHEHLRKTIEVNGWAYLKTDAATRKTGAAFYGDNLGIVKYRVSDRYVNGSFRASLRVKKA